MEGADGARELKFPGCPAMPRVVVVLVVPRGSRVADKRRGGRYLI